MIDLRYRALELYHVWIGSSFWSAAYQHHSDYRCSPNCDDVEEAPGDPKCTGAKGYVLSAVISGEWAAEVETDKYPSRAVTEWALRGA